MSNARSVLTNDASPYHLDIELRTANLIIKLDKPSMYSIQKSGNATTICFNGSMKVERASRAKAAVETALAESGSVLINLEHIDDADLSFFQILCSAHRFARKVNKSLDVTGITQARLRQALKETRYYQPCSLGIDEFKNCLRTKKES